MNLLNLQYSIIIPLHQPLFLTQNYLTTKLKAQNDNIIRYFYFKYNFSYKYFLSFELAIKTQLSILFSQIMYKQRLMKQAIEASKRKFTQFLLMFNQADLLSWEAFVQGPKDTAYEGYIFLVKISLSSEYPIMPPKMYFKTKIFHPNIHYVTGQVCLDIIKSQWSPTWTLEALCRALRYLLQNPNEDSPLNCDAANLIRLKQIESYNHITKMYAKQYAIPRKNYDEKIKNQIMKVNQSIKK